jgi:hypothetical protein
MWWLTCSKAKIDIIMNIEKILLFLTDWLTDCRNRLCVLQCQWPSCWCLTCLPYYFNLPFKHLTIHYDLAKLVRMNGMGSTSLLEYGGGHYHQVWRMNGNDDDDGVSLYIHWGRVNWLIIDCLPMTQHLGRSFSILSPFWVI